MYHIIYTKLNFSKKFKTKLYRSKVLDYKIANNLLAIKSSKFSSKRD